MGVLRWGEFRVWEEAAGLIARARLGESAGWKLDAAVFLGGIGLRGLAVWGDGMWVQCGALAMVSRGTGPWMGGEQKWRAGERGRERSAAGGDIWPIV